MFYLETAKMEIISCSKDYNRTLERDCLKCKAFLITENYGSKIFLGKKSKVKIALTLFGEEE